MKKTKMRGLSDRDLATMLRDLDRRVKIIDQAAAWCMRELKHPAFMPAVVDGEVVTDVSPAEAIAPADVIRPAA